MRKPLILVGGGGHCRSVIDAAESAGYTIKGILDLPDTLGREILGYKIIGNDDDIPKFVDSCDFVITLGFIKNADVRIKLHHLIENHGGRLAAVIASTAHVSKYSAIGDGSVVLHQANVNAGVVIGKSVIINSCANVEHDVVIEDFCHISTGAMINGDCKIKRSCFIGSQSVLVQGTTINSNTIIGAGTVVVNDISKAGEYVGNPVRMIKEL